MRKRFKLISCEILFREVCHCASICDNIIDIEFMPKSLHDIGCSEMYEKLRSALERVDTEKYDALLLGYGLCNNGVAGLSCPIDLVLPRAHDCVTLLLGSKERYKEVFFNNPGTYFYSSGWVERAGISDESITSRLGINRTYDEYVRLYGEENAEYLAEMLGGWLNTYNKLVYINTGNGNISLDREAAKKTALERKWEYNELSGDTSLLLKMMNGLWEENEFLVVPPGSKIHPSNDDDIVAIT